MKKKENHTHILLSHIFSIRSLIFGLFVCEWRFFSLFAKHLFLAHNINMTERERRKDYGCFYFFFEKRNDCGLWTNESERSEKKTKGKLEVMWVFGLFLSPLFIKQFNHGNHEIWADNVWGGYCSFITNKLLPSLPLLETPPPPPTAFFPLNHTMNQCICNFVLLSFVTMNEVYTSTHEIDGR